MPNVHYIVRVDDEAVGVRDVRGLPGEDQIIEYRHGNSPVFYPIKMPGLGRVGNVVVDNVAVTGQSSFGRWAAGAGPGGREITIAVMDETGVERVAWTLHAAHPVRPVAMGGGRVEELEIACAGIDVVKGRA